MDPDGSDGSDGSQGWDGGARPTSPDSPGDSNGMGEVLSSDTGPLLPAPRPSSRGRRPGRIMAGVAAVMALVVVGGGYAAWSALNGGGTQPEQVLPANTVAFVKLDLNPSAGQKIDLYRLLQKFPDLVHLKSGETSFSGWVSGELSQAATGGSLNYSKDIAPWLGDRFAVAVVPTGSGTDSTAQPVLAFAETNQQAATAAMTKLRRSGDTQLGYTFTDGYLVVSPTSPSAAKAAVTAAAKSSLASNKQFTSDVASLNSDEVVTAWVDASSAGSLLQHAVESALGSASMMAPAGIDPSGLTGTGMLGQAWKGRFVLGLHATSNGLELQMKTFGATAGPAVPPLGNITSALPDAFAVVAVSNPGAQLSSGWKQLAASPGYADMQKELKAAGLSLPADLNTLLGSKLVVSIGGSLQQPTVLAVTNPSHPAAAAVIARKLLGLAGMDPAQIGVTTSGNQLLVGSAESVAGPTSGGPTTSQLFGQAVADPSHAQALVFVNLAPVWSGANASGNPSAEQRELENIAAVGLSSTTSGTTSTTTLRLIVR
jgi:Protein of unknown function (DUF3352)